MSVGNRVTVAREGRSDAGSTPVRRTVGARRTVIGLAVLAVAIYFGFILMMTWR